MGNPVYRESPRAAPKTTFVALPTTSSHVVRPLALTHPPVNASNASNMRPHILGNKTIFFVRHAQAEHNLPPYNQQLRDPRLTAHGTRQAQRLHDLLPADVRARLQLVVCSPMQRALQTAHLAFGRQFDWNGLSLVLHADVQEVGEQPCDMGVPKDRLQELYPDFAQQIEQHLAPDWFLKEEEHTRRRRVERFQTWLLSRPESVILVVTHNGFLRELLGEHVWSCGGRTPQGFETAEIRRFTLAGERGAATWLPQQPLPRGELQSSMVQGRGEAFRAITVDSLD